MAENSTHGRLGLMAGALSALAVPLFGVNIQKLPSLEYWVLTLTFGLSLGVCTLVAARRLWLGTLVLPPVCFGLMCLVCWWIAMRMASP